MSNNPYEALGLDKSASVADIKKAYRKMARKHHPDLNPGDQDAEAKFKAASGAYDLLKDTEQRARFDRGEIDASGAEQQQQRQYYRDFAEQGGHGYQSSQGYQDMGDMSDIFAEILRQRGQSGGASGGYDARGADERYHLEVGFLEAVKGGKKRITLPSGDNLEVTIPQGTADGQTIRLRGKGGAGMGKGPRGDAYVTISLRDHSVFSREGDDILVTLPITIDEAVLGGKVAAPTIDGPVNVTIPKGANSGQTLRLRGRGVARGGKLPGDQRISLRIVTPEKPDAELQSFMETWRTKNSWDPRKQMLQEASR